MQRTNRDLVVDSQILLRFTQKATFLGHVDENCVAWIWSIFVINVEGECEVGIWMGMECDVAQSTVPNIGVVTIERISKLRRDWARSRSDCSCTYIECQFLQLDREIVGVADTDVDFERDTDTRGCKSHLMLLHEHDVQRVSETRYVLHWSQLMLSRQFQLQC